MICAAQQCVFVHVPKTGGQSVEQFFLELNGLTLKQKQQLLISRNDDPAKGPSRLAHMRAHEYVDCGHMSQDDYDRYFSFAFVRNPWSRLVSEYLHKKLDNKYSFKQWVFEAMPEADDFSDAYRHVIPQTDYLVNSQGDVIVNFVGRFENLQNDFNKVCEKLNIANTTLPHANSTSSFRRSLERKIRHLFIKEKRIKQHYTAYYDNETIDKVATLYASDIAMFNYTFDE